MSTDGKPPQVIASFAKGTPCAREAPKIAAGADGTAWLACGSGIMRVGPDGQLRFFGVAQGADNPIVGHDASVWFSSGKWSVGRLTPEGALRIWSVLPWGCPGLVFTVDAEGRVWYASVENRYVGYFDPVRFQGDDLQPVRLLGYDTTGPLDGPSLTAIAAAADGSIWVAGSSDLYRVTQATTTWVGAAAARPTPLRLRLNTGARRTLEIGGLAATADGSVWATIVGVWTAPSPSEGKIVRVHADGRYQVLRLGLPGPLRSPRLDAGGRLWGTVAAECLEEAYGFRYSRSPPSIVVVVTLPDPSSRGSTRSVAAVAASIGCRSGLPRAILRTYASARGRLQVRFTGQIVDPYNIKIVWRRPGAKTRATRIRFAEHETSVATTTAPAQPGRYRVTVLWYDRIIGRAAVTVRRG